MDTLTERAVRTLLFIAGLFTLPALAPDMALMLGGYLALMGVLALALLGVAAYQVEAVSFGKEKPADTGSGESAWAKNRRAEIAYR